MGAAVGERMEVGVGERDTERERKRGDGEIFQRTSVTLSNL